MITANGFLALRRHLISAPILSFVRKTFPSISETERAALDAGTVWWDADLFRGNPDWSKLLAMAPARLSDIEKEKLVAADRLMR
jgi:acyl-CoA dehydrogenase